MATAHLLLIAAICITGGNGNTAFHFQADNIPTTASFALTTLNYTSFSDSVSVCTWFRVEHFRKNTYVSSYVTSDRNNNDLNIKVAYNTVAVFLGGFSSRYYSRTPLVIPGHWFHLCFVNDPSNNNHHIYLDGKLLRSVVPRNPRIALNGTVVLGQEADLHVGAFEKYQSFSGYIMDYNMYNRTLSDKEVEALAFCDGLKEFDPGEGDLVGWSTTDWRVEGNVTFEEINKGSICRSRIENNEQLLPFVHPFTMKEASEFCGALKGYVALPQDSTSNDILFRLARPMASSCKTHMHVGGFLWLGATDEMNEGVWRSRKTGDILQYSNFLKKTDTKSQDCALLQVEPYDRMWDDTSCNGNMKYCVICEVERSVVLTLRGLCDENPSDTMFLVESKGNMEISFRGFTKYEIALRGSAWVLYDAWVQVTVAILDARNILLPLGTNYWVLNTNFTICGKEAGTSHLLTLSACRNDEYTCMDGSCIALEQRCDLRVDCADSSDELGCKKLIAPDEYFSELPPHGVSNGPLRVDGIVNIFGFSKIDTLDMRITVDFQFVLSWFDQRLQYRSLKNTSDLNVLEPDTVWTPKVSFPNADFPNIDSLPAVTSVYRGAPPLPDDLSRGVRDELYLGSENPLMWQQQTSAPFNCAMDLRNFPFDTQRCQLHLKLTSANTNYIRWGNVTAHYLGKALMSEHEVSEWHVERHVDGGYSMAIINFALRRRVDYYVTSAYFPTTMLIIISYASLFCKHENRDLRVLMCLTTLLVLYSLHQQITDRLPKTSFTKAIDIWCFFAISYIFTQVIFHVLVDLSPFVDAIQRCSRRKVGDINEDVIYKKRSTTHFVYYCARIFYIIVFVVFVSLYWTIVFYNMS
ncbi:uncharacterized protein LOC143020649 [Oratosquilla oratoria]|uniref:uncharacterized protein LOC143020649 n=1 Tax=Oratosquilla oratoria TaxID=337810 RepID=UPI003F76FD60